MDNRTKDRLKEGLRDYVESITRKSGGTAYICPICGSGTGKNRTGAFNIDPKDPTRWKCFACGNSGDIFDLIGAVEGITEYTDRVKRAGEVLGIDATPSGSDKHRSGAQGGKMTQQAQQKTEEQGAGFMDYYRQCAARIGETDYLQRRGISQETAARYMIGYDPQYRVKGGTWQAIIIPTGLNSYVVRNTDPNAGDGERYRNKGQAVPFNWKGMSKAQHPIFIVEGEIDALSIIEAGGDAVGLGSTANVNLFTNNYVKNNPPQRPFVIALDNDAAGDDAAEKLAGELDALEIAYYRWNPAGEYKDANAALQAEPEAFREMVARADQLEAQALQEAREEYEKTSAAHHLQAFIDGIAESANTPAQPTGFANLDRALDGGLYEGLYFIGAITSLGKTTLALQIADQIAQSGRDVLIFSLEMARAELMSKSISRETVLEVLETGGDMRHAKTNRGITAGERWARYSREEVALIHKAMANYGEYAKHIYIHEGIGNIGVEQIRETVEQHIRLTGNSPVVVVDYVQILAPYDVRATDKQNTDKAVLELKRLSRDCKIPVVGISSFNRASYKEAVTLEAFKESGSLEYGSDVLIGLQLEGVGAKDFDATAAKRKDPREIELVILKNRNGRTGEKVAFSYYALFNYFEEVEGRPGTGSTRKRY